VAVSGGKDSLSLLRILARITRGHGGELVAITVDEGIAGYREESLEFASEMARQLGVSHYVISYKELYGTTLDDALKLRRDKLSSCAICGTFRRRAIDVAAVRAGVDVLATAHNLDDIVQTFLINLLNGDLKRIGWLNPSAVKGGAFGVRRVHPFMEVYEKEIALYAFAAGLNFQSVPCPYMDEGIRASVRSYLNRLEDEHPGVKYTLLKSALELSAMAASRRPDIVKCSKCGFPSTSDPCSVCAVLEVVGRTTL